jgi:hypothetical protein
LAIKFEQIYSKRRSSSLDNEGCYKVDLDRRAPNISVVLVLSLTFPWKLVLLLAMEGLAAPDFRCVLNLFRLK